MSIEDYRINAFVRSLLSRCWVDLTKVRYGTTARTVFFQGRFQRIRPPHASDEWESHASEMAENVALLENFEKELRRDPSVADVVFRFDNFRKIHGKWTAKET